MNAESLWLKGARRHLVAYGECYANLDLDVPRSHWLDRVLPNLGYLEKRLIEFSMPVAGEIATEFKKALAELETADKDFIRGTYGQVLVHCRSALIAITTAFRLDLGDDKAQFKARARAFKEQRLVPVIGETQGQLVVDLLEALWWPLSGATKPGGGEASRGYAQFVLHLTSSLLGYIGRVLN